MWRHLTQNPLNHQNHQGWFGLDQTIPSDCMAGIHDKAKRSIKESGDAESV